MAHSLLPQEVTNFHFLSLLINRDVDGEVSVHEAHLIAEAMSYTRNHVLNMTADGTDDGDVLVRTKPEIHKDLITFFVDIHKLVRKVAVESAPGTSHNYTSALNRNLH